MEYFKFKEFIDSDTAKKYNIDNIPDFYQIDNIKKLADILNKIREQWGSPILINSGYRCPELNKLVNGVKNSEHLCLLNNAAADIVPINGDTKGLFKLIVSMIENSKITVGQLIDELNYSWIHISLITDKHKNEIKHL